MTTPTVYVICDTNCKYEGMTKEQIYTAIAQAVESGTIGDINTGFITTIKTITGTPLKFFVGTQAEYNKLTDDDKQDLFAIISDDTTREGILAAIAELQTETAANTAAIQTNTVNITNNTNKILAHSTRLSIAETNIEDITASMAAQNKEIEANTKAIAENADNLEDHAKHNFECFGAYTITNGSGTLSTGRRNKLEGNGLYYVMLIKASGGSTYIYNGIMKYTSSFVNVINVGDYKIIINGDFIECEDLTLNGDLWCYKIGEIGGL